MQSQFSMAIGLTLEEKKDRKEHIFNELTKNISSFIIHENKLHENPFLGCLDSHVKAIQYAKDNRMNSVFICEDDILISERFHVLEPPPGNWDMLYFGGILTCAHDNPQKGWVKGVIWCAHAYVVKSNMFDKIIDTYKELDREMFAENSHTIDWLYTTFIHPHHDCFLDESQSIIQKEGVSTLTHKNKWGEKWNWDTYSMKNLEDIV